MGRGGCCACLRASTCAFEGNRGCGPKSSYFELASELGGGSNGLRDEIPEVRFFFVKLHKSFLGNILGNILGDILGNILGGFLGHGFGPCRVKQPCGVKQPQLNKAALWSSADSSSNAAF